MPPDASDSYLITAVVSINSGVASDVTCTLSAGASTVDSRDVTGGLGSHVQLVLTGSATLSTTTSVTVSCNPGLAIGVSATGVSMTAILVSSLN